MKPSKFSRGSSLVELMVCGFVTLLTGVALLALMQTTYTARSVVMGENTTLAQARQTLDILSDSIRNGQPYNVSGTASQTIRAANSSSVTVYNATATGEVTGNDTTQYFLSGTNLQEIVTSSGNAGTAVTLVPNVQSLRLSYYITDGSRNTRDYTRWNLSVTPNPTTSPASSDYPKIGAVNISATVTVSGITRTISSFVKLRNNPR